MKFETLAADAIDRDALQSAIDEFDVTKAKLVPAPEPGEPSMRIIGIDVVPGFFINTDAGLVSNAEAYFEIGSGANTMTDSSRADVVFTSEDGHVTIVEIKAQNPLAQRRAST